MIPRSRTPAGRRVRLLHLHSSFSDAQALRSVQLINAFGPACEHVIASAQASDPDAGHAIAPGIAFALDADFPALKGRPTPGRLQRLASAMAGHDLVLTYGYGAMDAVMAHTVFGGSLPLPPLVHHEDEPGALTATRNWYRRVALGRTAALVVPTAQLAATAIAAWHQPAARVKQIMSGIRTSAYGTKPRRDALPRIIKRDGELWLGTLAELIAPEDPSRLVRALGALPGHWQLVILGDSPHANAIRDEALRLDLGHRVHLPGVAVAATRALGLFDLFVLPSVAAQPPLAIIEAMATGLAVVATGSGTAAALLAPENRPYVAADDEPSFTAALRALATAPDLRASIGAANRRLARSDHDEAGMVAAYRTVYGAALGQAHFP